MFQNGFVANTATVDEITDVEIKQEIEELMNTRFALLNFYLHILV